MNVFIAIYTVVLKFNYLFFFLFDCFFVCLFFPVLNRKGQRKASRKMKRLRFSFVVSFFFSSPNLTQSKHGPMNETPSYHLILYPRWLANCSVIHLHFAVERKIVLVNRFAGWSAPT